MHTFENLNQTLIGMSRTILEEGQWRTVRGHRCLEIPHPTLIEITNPTDRYVTIPERKWNKYLPFAESLWMALGLNNLNSLPGRYVKNLYNYSDNGTTWRGGYGPRIRAFSGLGGDYRVSEPEYRDMTVGYTQTTDQLRYVVEKLRQELSTRQAIIQLGDPAKDCFTVETRELKETKDYPCSRVLQFMMVNGALNCTLYIRSNDIVYGLSAVNVTNFTLMQEYIANILHVPVGKYYHFVNNLHVYDNHLERVREFARMDLRRYRSRHGVFQYNDHLTLEELDRLLLSLYRYEKGVYSGECDEFVSFRNDMVNDWAKVFLRRANDALVPEFVNPYLNDLFYEPK